MAFSGLSYKVHGSRSMMIMKSMKSVLVVALISGLLAVAFTVSADEAKKDKKPYPLTKCVVSDEKLGGDMGEPYVFKYKGREVRLCCKDCLKDFNKNPAKYVKKIEEAEAKAKKQ